MILNKDNKLIGERLAKIEKDLNIRSSRQMAISIDMDTSYYAKALKGEASISEKYINALGKIYGINPHWLLYGNGTMYRENVPRETPGSYRDHLKNVKTQPRRNTVPFYDAEGHADPITETEMSPIHAPSGTIDIGDLLHDSQAAIRIYGNSMLPNYPPGCVVGLSKANEGFIEPGEVYVVETSGKRMLKRLFYKDDNSESDYITLYSDNTMKFEGGARNGKLAYPPVNIHKKEVINLFLVTGVIKRNSNSIIMHRNNKP